MQFIEQLFGLYPDGGSGLVELVIVLAPILVLVLKAILRWRLKRVIKQAI